MRKSKKHVRKSETNVAGMEEIGEAKTPSTWVQDIIDTGEPWTDPDFLPGQSSMSTGNFGSQYEWKRCSEIFTDDP